MNHLTDEQIAKFWMGGPAEEAMFYSEISHLHKCKVCRERSWHFLQSMQKMRRDTHKFFEAIFSKAFTSGLAEIVTDTPAEAPATESSLSKMLVGVIKHALGQLDQNPGKSEWDGEELFGTDQFDDISHMSRCQRCRGLLDALTKTVDNVVEEAIAGKKEKVHLTGLRLQQWLNDVHHRLKKNMDLLGVTDNEGSADDHKSFCD